MAKKGITKTKGASSGLKKFSKGDLMSILRKMPGGNHVENVREAFSDEDDFSSDTDAASVQSESDDEFQVDNLDFSAVGF